MMGRILLRLMAIIILVNSFVLVTPCWGVGSQLGDQAAQLVFLESEHALFLTGGPDDGDDFNPGIT